jgi:hypothetical protein
MRLINASRKLTDYPVAEAFSMGYAHTPARTGEEHNG